MRNNADQNNSEYGHLLGSKISYIPKARPRSDDLKNSAFLILDELSKSCILISQRYNQDLEKKKSKTPMSLLNKVIKYPNALTARVHECPKPPSARVTSDSSVICFTLSLYFTF